MYGYIYGEMVDQLGKLLLALANTVILAYGSHGTHVSGLWG
jgi:hypothetical protein